MFVSQLVIGVKFSSISFINEEISESIVVLFKHDGEGWRDKSWSQFNRTTSDKYGGSLRCLYSSRVHTSIKSQYLITVCSLLNNQYIISM